MEHPDAERPNGFLAIGLDADLVNALTALGYEEPTAIQREAVPSLLAGRDVLGQAATGTGKTAAFALPLLQRLRHSATAGQEPRGVRGLIVVPTRELAMQVAQGVHAYGKTGGLRVAPIYGGQSMRLQLRALERGVDVVVATPGRALDHVQRGTLALDRVETVVLDEADEMLDMGFAEDLEAIFSRLPAERQTALFSATVPRRILAIAERYLRDPVRVTIAQAAATADRPAQIREVAYSVPRPHRMVALSRVLDMENPTAVIVFCRTRGEVDEVASTFSAHGYEAQALHGGLSQEQRDRVLSQFRSNATDVLVATDVAARGLDIDHVSHVVNYEVPSSPEVYTHRIGRTGRAGRTGTAITFVDGREMRLLRNIEQQTKRRISLEPLPTVDDLRERRLEQTRASLIERLNEGANDRFRRLVDELGAEHPPAEVAAAALALLDASLHGIGGDEGGSALDALPAARTGPNVKLYVNAGRRQGIRPGDLVGAIATMARVAASEIGTITLSDRFALVEVPSALAEQILKSVRSLTIRGQRIALRRDRDA